MDCHFLLVKPLKPTGVRENLLLKHLAQVDVPKHMSDCCQTAEVMK